MLMLTSGSTGNAKAVCLRHKQVLAAVSGKAAVRPLHPQGPFLNWVGLDHVVSLVEIHIQALWLGVDQVHVQAGDVVSQPDVFLELLSRHRVARTFAPNFFLGKLVSTEHSMKSLDLTNLQIVASGGEANDTKTCAAAAVPNVITPGFGMTETCAGAIFNLDPEYDLQKDFPITSLGNCMPGIEMRVIVDSRQAEANETGNLKVKGDVVFDGYYRNPGATAEAFPSKDGWFRTGDCACIDSQGNLRLGGRMKETVNINSIKIAFEDIVNPLEQAIGDKVNRFVVFPTRAAHTEQITLCYIPKEQPQKIKDAIKIEQLTSEACITSTSNYPLVFSLRSSSIPLIPVSSLGKISRAKMRSLFESGVFNEDISSYRKQIEEFKNLHRTTSAEPETEEEKLFILDFAETLDICVNSVGPETRVFDMGFTSIDLIRLKKRIDLRLGVSVPIITLMKNPTARSLASALRSVIESARAEELEYDPVVVLQSKGSRTPLWLVHPGVGEVLVFLGLAKHLAPTERPIYALRAKGFETGQTRFATIAETVDTYVEAIKKRQPRGPYALAGYSYGAMLAFEIAKRLDSIGDGAEGDSVQFLGSFNLPPNMDSTKEVSSLLRFC